MRHIKSSGTRRFIETALKKHLYGIYTWYAYISGKQAANNDKIVMFFSRENGSNWHNLNIIWQICNAIKFEFYIANAYLKTVAIKKNETYQ